MRTAILVPFLLLTPLAVKAQSSVAALQPGREHVSGAEVLLDTVQTKEGYPLRAFITRPQGATGKLPVIFMVGWLSCDTVEAPKEGPDDGFKQLLFDLASRSGYATYRVDKPGVGESKGPACRDADFNAELAAYRAAFAAMSAVDFIDASRIYILGFSNGGGFAPLVPGTAPVRGYMVFGGWYKTWLEHMMEHERRRMKLSGLSEAAINSRMRSYATFYDLYLNQRRLPGEIVRGHPEMKEIWHDEPDRQYGRPAAFYQQLQALNLAEAWQSVDAPVLAIHGEYDWIMSGDDDRLLADAINTRHPGSATYIEWPVADHLLLTHATLEKAFAKDPDEKYDPKLSQSVLEWLKTH
jgi:pimeloyl-ACP methyl ester carboxylesterase